MNKGYIYILENPAMPNLVKIGKTERSAYKRAEELSGSTGIPFKFQVAYEKLVSDCDNAEAIVHNRLKEYRVANNREFFNLNTKKAIELVSKIIIDELLYFEDEKKELNFESSYADFFICYPGIFIKILSKFYNFDEDIIKKYRRKWDWDRISSNEFIVKNNEFIYNYSEHLNWDILSKNIDVSEGKNIHAYKNNFNWDVLCKNQNVLWTKDLLFEFKDYINLLELFHYGKIDLEINDIACIFIKELEDLKLTYKGKPKNYIMWRGWSRLSNNSNLKWKSDAIEMYKSKLFWGDFVSSGGGISQNSGIPWDEHLVNKFESQIYWSGLSFNRGKFWTDEIIEKFKNKWDWKTLSWNTSLPWSLVLIDKYKDLWTFGSMGPCSLSNNIALPWSRELIEKYRELWSFADWFGLSSNKSIAWNEELMILYSSKLEKKRVNNTGWHSLCENPSVKWDESLIRKYETKLNFEKLSSNEGVLWSFDLLKKYASKLNIDKMCENKTIWKRVFIDVINQDLIDYVIRRI